MNVNDEFFIFSERSLWIKSIMNNLNFPQEILDYFTFSKERLRTLLHQTRIWRRNLHLDCVTRLLLFLSLANISSNIRSPVNYFSAVLLRCFSQGEQCSGCWSGVRVKNIVLVLFVVLLGY